ncbi:uncharacterized protein [Euphorbia lathyris]|uniref:uncharacterized protein isoform X5 n=1 Tax=Euphorbia lathyris TaxID=212925 RepID=UPI00331422BE
MVWMCSAQVTLMKVLEFRSEVFCRMEDGFSLWLWQLLCLFVHNGAMRLEKDAPVVTQAAKSKSITFVSQSLNEGKDAYRRQSYFGSGDSHHELP